MQKYIPYVVCLIVGFAMWWLYWANSTTGLKNLTPEALEAFFRTHTVNDKHAVAIKSSWTIQTAFGPISWNDYLWTIHWYPNNKSVCEELVLPYNLDSSLSAIPDTYYYCELLSP